MKAAELIKKYNITYNGETTIRVNIRPTTEGLEEIKTGKAEIISILKDEKAEREATEKATFEFWITGWESHQVSVDTRKDINEQLEEIANYYRNDTTIDLVKESYNKAINDTKEKATKASKAEAETEAIFAAAKATGQKQILKKYIDDCDGSVRECSTDSVTIYAMPDGTTTETRIHTF